MLEKVKRIAYVLSFYPINKKKWEFDFFFLLGKWESELIGYLFFPYLQFYFLRKKVKLGQNYFYFCCYYSLTSISTHVLCEYINL